MKQLYRNFLLVISFCFSASVALAIGHTATISSSMNALCFGSCTGSATVSVSGGTGPFTYSWAPVGGTSPTANNLCAGPYTVTVTDQSDGSTATATVTITEPTQITVSATNVVQATCGFANGSACMNVSGGVPAYTFLWVPGNMTTPCATNLVSGSYTLIVTDANGCTGSGWVNIPNASGPMVTNVTANPVQICSGASAVLTPSMCCGTGPFTYNWSNPGNTLNNPSVYSPTASPTVTTSYTFTVTDMNGCIATGVGTVSVTPAVAGNIVTTDATCNQSNGAMQANVTNGTPPYTYSWSNAQSTPAISNLSAGQYSVTITDNFGCTIMLADGVSNIGGPSVSVSVVPNGCTNSSNGNATANVTGISPFTYQWNTNPVQTTQTAINLTQGNYLVTVTDSAGCVTVAGAQVNPLAGNLYLYANWDTPDNCSANTGSASSVVSGGTMPYTYNWSTGDTSANISGLSAGVYSLSVMDANGCAVGGSVAIPSFCGSYISGRVYIDMNQNGAFDSGDVPLQYSPVQVGPYYGTAFTNTQGIYWRIVTAIDTFTVSHIPPTSNYTIASPASGNQQVIITALGDTSLNNDFVYHVPGPFQDLYLSLASGVARPGFQQLYTVICQNRGTTTVSDTIWFLHDSILTQLGATPVFDGYAHPQGYWLFNNFTPGQSMTKYVYMQVPTIQNGGYLGRQLLSNARIEPTALDSTSGNNGDDEVDFITGSYDPNLKECYSPTMNEYGDIWPNDIELEYTIHFQNTGTDTAFTVVVVDTLPAELDVTTFRLGASSHPCTFELSGFNGTNVITFTFMNILLPDSNVNEAASHGYVQFEIDRFPNLPIGTQILNEAHNYFDFNPAIVTNTDTVTITDPLAVTNNAQASFEMYPNPTDADVTLALSQTFSGQNAVVIVRDLSGREIMRTSTNGSTTISLETDGLAAGIYTITVVCPDYKPTTQKLIITEK